MPRPIFEGFQLAILRDLEWQATARKTHDPNLNSAKAENVPVESGKSKRRTLNLRQRRPKGGATS
jgi:hypothetical protein